jgi:glycosyltransferase involved in cell wall biosynthesis
MLKIGVDIRPLGWGRQTGIPRATHRIMRELALSAAERYIPMRFDQSTPFLATAHKLDALLSFYYPVPARPPLPGVLFIHDLIPVRFAAEFGCPELTLLFERIRHSAQASRRILTNSFASKRDIVEIWGIDSEKIAVVPLAADDTFKAVAQNEERSRNEADALLRRHNIVSPYILSVGTIEPRKNLTRLLHAYERIRDRHTERFHLVFAGGLGWRYEEFLQQLAASRYRGDIVLTGHVADRELAALYRHAAVFAYPSLYEGFGLPILEAMACGAPVVTSAISSMPEVGGDCACYCDPLSVESIVHALETVLGDEPGRRAMSAAGLERAARYSWPKTAALVRANLLQAAQKA